jgi:hypothetical protein
LAETQALIREAYSSIHWVLRLGHRSMASWTGVESSPFIYVLLHFW